MKGWVRPVVVGVLACLLASLYGTTLARWRYERSLSDLWHRLAGERHAAEHVGLVVVDRETLNAHREEPLVTWGPYFAQAIGALRQAGAVVVAIDFQFNVSLEEWLARMQIDGGEVSRTWDAPLREQLSKGSVILAGGFEGDELVLPVPGLLYSLPNQLDDVGLANLVPDEDGVVRRFIPTIPTPERSWRTFGALAAERAGISPERLAGSEQTTIPWLGPPGTVPSISFERLLQPGAAEDPAVVAMKGRTVVIGTDTTQDVHLTPYRMMRGPEIQANVIDALVSGRTVDTASGVAHGIFLAVAVVLAVLLGFGLKPGGSIVAQSALAAAVGAAGFAAFLDGWVLGVAPAQVGILLSGIGALGVRLGGERRRRRELTELFGRYVSDDVVEMLVASGRTPQLGGELVPVTVLFMDIRNFTTISEKMSPQEVVAGLNSFFGRAVEPILEQGGTVDKFLGDGLMALFGSPQPWEDHARRACRAALEMDRIAREFREWPDFAVGIGIHTGEAVTGNVGSDKRMEFTAIGDTINTSARIESTTKKMGVRILISSAVVEEAGPGLVLGVSDAVMVKGRQEAVQVHELVGMEETE